MLLTFIVIAAAIATPVAFAQDNVAWGPPQGGIRIGITTSPTAARVLFENTGSTEQTVAIGRTTGLGPVYSLKFTAIAPDGKEIPLLNGGVGAVAGYMGPLVLHLAPGKMEEIAIPMKHVFMIVQPGIDRPLNEILNLHYAVSVSLSVDQSEVDWTRRSNTTFSSQTFWTGTMTSGRLRNP